MRNIPTEAELNAMIKMVEITVTGQYIARLNEKNKTTKRYEIQVQVPENFTRSDIKRLTALALKSYPDFVMMRTHEHDGKAPKKMDVKRKRRDMYTERDLGRFERLRVEKKKSKKAEDEDEGALPPFADEEVA